MSGNVIPGTLVASLIAREAAASHRADEAFKLLERLSELEAADDANGDLMTDDPYIEFVEYARQVCADFRTLKANSGK